MIHLSNWKKFKDFENYAVNEVKEIRFYKPDGSYVIIPHKETSQGDEFVLLRNGNKYYKVFINSIDTSHDLALIN